MMALHMLKYLELNFPVLSDFGKIRNDDPNYNSFFGVLWESDFCKMLEHVANLGFDLL